MTTDTLKSTRCPSVSDLDRQIAALLQQDDETCLRLAFSHYYRPLCLYATRYLLSPDDIEDLVQGAFISLWRNHRGRFFTGSVRAYLFGAVAKASLKRMEEEQRYFFVDLESVTDSLIDELTAESDSDRERILGRRVVQIIIDDGNAARLPFRNAEVLGQEEVREV